MRRPRCCTTVYYPGALYRPVTMLTYMANHQVSTDPFGFHLVNVLLHALVTLAVLALARELLGSLLAATVAAALFAVHPVHTEAVSNIVGRAELLAAFLRAGDRCSRRSAPRAPNRTRDGVCISPPSSPSPPGCSPRRAPSRRIALIAIVVWWVDPRRSLVRTARAILPFAAVGVAYLGLRVVVVGALGLPSAPPLSTTRSRISAPRPASPPRWSCCSTTARC